MKIYPAITTTDGSNWRQMLEDCAKLGISQVALFPTCLNYDQRQDFYNKVKVAGITSAPFVHLRSDMTLDEVEFLIKEFGTEVFNVQSKKDHPLDNDLSKYKNIIYLENGMETIADEIDDWAGICLDVSHLEDKRLRQVDPYNEIIDLLESHPCGCWHLNAIKKEPVERLQTGDGVKFYDSHYLSDLSELDYCLRYKKYLAPHIALELENPISEQLEAKKYVEKLLGIQ